jgi:hypothetical protein
MLGGSASQLICWRKNRCLIVLGSVWEGWQESLR